MFTNFVAGAEWTMNILKCGCEWKGALQELINSNHKLWLPINSYLEKHSPQCLGNFSIMNSTTTFCGLSSAAAHEPEQILQIWLRFKAMVVAINSGRWVFAKSSFKSLLTMVFVGPLSVRPRRPFSCSSSCCCDVRSNESKPSNYSLSMLRRPP